jgi:hypothetical protein
LTQILQKTLAVLPQTFRLYMPEARAIFMRGLPRAISGVGLQLKFQTNSAK